MCILVLKAGVFNLHDKIIREWRDFSTAIDSMVICLSPLIKLLKKSCGNSNWSLAEKFVITG